ncbi:Fructose-2,6-bisphosphatase [Leucoagaricus gongylophorus]
MLIQWLKEGGNVGIHDATNSTRARRAWIEERVKREKGLDIIFLESLCDDPAVIAANVALKVSSGDPDYKDMSPEDAKRDFLRRIQEYEKVYETITEDHLSYLRIVNVGSNVTVSNIHGYLASRIAFYLMNLHLKPRSIYLSRHGESQFNVEGKIGGDSLLSPRGMQYADALPDLITDNIGDAPLTVWTSTLKRTIQTGSKLPYPKLTWKSLDELDAGVCDGMTYEEIEQAYPDDFANRDEDKFNYRYRGGESYRDVVVRLEPVIMELERQENILIIGHQAILRCLYAYFHNLPQADLPYIKIPLHTVVKLTLKAYGCDEERYTLPIKAVDTHRPKPSGPTVKVQSKMARQYFTEEDTAAILDKKEQADS